MERYYRFAGIELSIDIPEKKIYEDERRLRPFAVENVQCPQIYKVEMVDMLDEPTGTCIAQSPSFCIYQDGEQRIRYIGSNGKKIDGAYIRVSSCGKEHVIQLLNEKYPDYISTKTILNSIGAEHLLAQNQGFILHCSYIERNGKAILFTAPSGTGKSTQADLWNLLRNATIINGDRAAVRMVKGQMIAEGIPFAGSSKYCENRSLPIEAIVYLGQAPQNKVERLTGSKAFRAIWEGVSVNVWDASDVAKCMDIVKKIVEEISVYRLECLPDETAIIALEEVLESKR